MKKSSFLTGLLISPLFIGAYWLYENSHSSPKIEGPSTVPLTLLDINYIPLKQNDFFGEHPFFKIEPTGAVEQTIHDFSGKPAIVHVWATWCAPCVEEMPGLDKFAQTHGKDIHIIALVGDKKTGENIKKFYDDHHITTLSIYIDKGGVLTRQLKVNSLPTSIFINAQGQILAVFWGKLIGRGKPEHF